MTIGSSGFSAASSYSSGSKAKKSAESSSKLSDSHNDALSAGTVASADISSPTSEVAGVTSFTPVSGKSFSVGGLTYWVQNGNHDWSLTNPDSQTLRFEVRSGDQWQYDPDWKERSEIASDAVYAPGQAVSVSYSVMIEPGHANTADWLVLGQFHADDGVTSPPMAMELVGDKMAIVLRYQLPGGAYQTQYVFQDTNDIVRGHYYDMKISANFENDNNGFLDVWRDGTQIVDYNGPIGYGYDVYWKMGVYRAESKETIAVNYKDFFFDDGTGGVVIVGTSQGDTIAQDETPPGQPTPTNNGDQIYTKAGQDTVNAGAGADLISSGSGSDTLNAGKGNDEIVGGPGNDVLKGGRGKDAFRFAGDFGKDKIRDFHPNQDLIVFDNAFKDYADLKTHMESHKGGTLITDGHDSLFLSKVKFAKLDAHDFMFA